MTPQLLEQALNLNSLNQVLLLLPQFSHQNQSLHTLDHRVSTQSHQSQLLQLEHLNQERTLELVDTRTQMVKVLFSQPLLVVFRQWRCNSVV